MLYDLTLGRLDITAVRERRAIVVRPLDMRVVARLLGELGGVDDRGRPALGGGRVEVGDGYVVVPWLMPYPVPEAVEFARPLREASGCLMADLGRRELVTPERFEREAAATYTGGNGAPRIPDRASDGSGAKFSGQPDGRP